MEDAERTGSRTAGKLVSALIVLVALASVIGLYSCLPKKAAPEATASAPAVNVEVEVIRPLAEAPDVFELVGMVEPNRVVEIAAEVAGRVERIGATDGDPVVKGAELVALNTELLAAEVDRTEATARYDQREHERIAEAARQGVATDKEIDQARSKRDASKAEWEAAKARLDRATILAPITGVLDDVIPEVGMYVVPGQVVARLVDMDVAKVVLNVPERDVGFLAVGDSEQIVVGPGPQATVAGRISYIGELADQASNTTRVELSVANRPRVLRSGQIVRAKLVRRTLKDVVLVPLETVLPLEGRDGPYKAVYLVGAGDVAERRPVSVDLGFIRGNRVLVTEGLVAGDRLIVVGQRLVGPGQPVRVTDASRGPSSAPSAMPRMAGDAVDSGSGGS